MKSILYDHTDLSLGLSRKLADGITTRIFSGDNVMLSLVTLEAGSIVPEHHHPEEQWGYLLEGELTLIQKDEEIQIKKGDFWQTPSNTPHAFRTGPMGAKTIDIFSPPREDYKKPGEGFGGGGS